MEKPNQLSTDSIFKLMMRFAIPAIVGLLVSALYNIVDSIFVGRGIGDLALAGVTVCFPIITIFMACVMLIGMGATALISIRLGEGKEEEAEKYISAAFLLIVIIGISLSIFGLIFLKPILAIFGASGEVMPFAVDYMRILLIGNVFFAIGIGMNNFIRAEGNPKTAMNTMIIGTITNIILDYIFIFIFNWGIKGAAAATVISYIVSSFFVMYYFVSGKSLLKIRKEHLRLKGAVIWQIIALGFPTFIIQATNSIQQMILNRSLGFYGGDTALAVIGIVMSLTSLLVMPAMGISQGAQPIIGYNFGAKQNERVKEALKLASILATLVITIGFIFTKLFPAQLIGLFNKNPEIIDMGVHGMDVFFKFIPLIGIQIISSSYFQAVGKSKQATFLGLSRQIFIFIPFLLLLPLWWGLEGVWWSAPFSDIGSFILTGIWLLIEMKSLGANKKNAAEELVL